MDDVVIQALGVIVPGGGIGVVPLLVNLRTITTHKLRVMKYCFKVGLYKQGLLHDLSKYAPVEFIPGIRYYQGTRSPNEMERLIVSAALSAVLDRFVLNRAPQLAVE